MGFKDPVLPAVEPESFLKKPLMERIHTLCIDWVYSGWGSPPMVPYIYIVKFAFLHLGLGLLIATLTSNLTPWDVADWWNEPIVYQKMVVWTLFLELLNLAGSWGPLTGKMKPMTGGARVHARVGTIRLRPWRWMPFTAGDRRTPLDVGLYLALLISLVVALVWPGTTSTSLAEALPDDRSGLIAPALLIAPIVLLILAGLRDKIVFLLARGEQYLPILIASATLSFVDMIIAFKLIIVVVWIGAGFSKIGRHFENVIPPMMSNAPFIPFKAIKRAHYRHYPDDLRPSGLALFMAHVLGTVVEMGAPLILLFSPNLYLTIVGVVLIVGLHVVIISTFPLAVPLEWNTLFSYAAIFLFLGFPAWDGYGVGDMSSPLLLIAILVALLFFPVLGNIRPDKVSFLPSMRQYAGNWASATWAYAPGAEEKMYRVTRFSSPAVKQFDDAGYGPLWAEVSMNRSLTWRAMHSQGRGLYSVLLKNLPDIDSRLVRDGETVCMYVNGWNFGDGHLHGEDFIAAVQSEARFEPGECIIVWVESEPVFSGVQEYKVIDAALGVIERGRWKVADAVREQPWLPNGPIPLDVTWTRS